MKVDPSYESSSLWWKSITVMKIKNCDENLIIVMKINHCDDNLSLSIFIKFVAQMKICQISYCDKNSSIWRKLACQKKLDWFDEHCVEHLSLRWIMNYWTKTQLCEESSPLWWKWFTLMKHHWCSESLSVWWKLKIHHCSVRWKFIALVKIC